MRKSVDSRKVRSAAKKLKLVELSGGKCVRCGFNKKHLLQFHHVDPSTKKFSIGRNDYRFSRLAEEAEKCILLCGNCHVLEHSKKEVASQVDRLRKNAMLNYIGSSTCSQCGESKSQHILEFHHVDHSSKEFNINSYRGSHLILPEYIKVELDKCIVLCRNCHLEQHFDWSFHESVSRETKEFSIDELKVVDDLRVLNLYDSGSSCSVICKSLGLSKSTVSTILIRNGRGKYKLASVTVDRISMKQYIEDGLKNHEISKIMKCSQSVVSRFRKLLTAG